MTTGADESIHDVHGGKFHFHLPHHDGGHDVCQTDPGSGEDELE